MPRRSTEDGSLSLEAVMVLPVLALLVFGVLEVAGLVRDVLTVHDAARAGARSAATSTGEAAVRAAANDASRTLAIEVTVDPVARSDGDVVTVTVTSERRLGPVTHQLRARAVARVEPAVGTTTPPRAPPSGAGGPGTSGGAFGGAAGGAADRSGSTWEAPR